MQELSAGIASLPVPAPLGVDLVGFLRRYAPAEGSGEPLTVTALVVDDGERRAVLVGLDLLVIRGDEAVHIRQAIADAADCSIDSVFVNCQHTHAAPPTPGMIKLGGLVHEVTPTEVAYWQTVVRTAATAAGLAVRELRPTRLGAASLEVEGLSVNRRERLPDGRTILGRNEDAPCDRSVSTLRFDDLHGDALATVVNFACHPVVVGPDVPEVSSDYVGPLRDSVRQWTGADCLFLQGCAGNVLPLESFMDSPGPERLFGRRLALAALSARSDAQNFRKRLQRTEYSSAVPIALYRWTPENHESARVDFAIRPVEFPLDDPPTLAEVRRIRLELEKRVESLRTSDASPAQWNPIEIHARWAEAVEGRIRDGSVERSLVAPVQGIRIGPVAVVGLPGEPFNEIGTRIKQSSPFLFTICCGYTNGAPGYLPTSEEYPHGGYEVDLNHRHYGNASRIRIGCDRLVESAARELLATLFNE